MNRVRLAAAALLGCTVLSGCSESITAAVLHQCANELVVTAEDTRQPGATVTLVPQDTRTFVWDYCCEVGADGTVTLSAGSWSRTVSFDDLRSDQLVRIPITACA